MEKSFVLVTALTGYLGYEKATQIAKTCLEKNKTVREVLMEDPTIDFDKISKILNPYEMTKPGIPGKR